MHGRRAVAAGFWVGATVGATALVWTATSVVARDVTDQPSHVVDQGEVAQALRMTTPAPLQAGAPAAAGQDRPAAAPTAGVGGERAGAGIPAAAPTTVPAPMPTTSSTTSTTTVPVAVPETVTTAPAPAPTTPPVGTFSTAAGTVTASCAGYFIQLVAATPADGYAVQVLDRGPATVDVHFSGPQEVQVRLVCFAGTPTRIPDRHESPSRPADRRES